MNTKGTFVVVLISVSTKVGYQRITLDCCRVFNRLLDAEDYYNSLITEVFNRHSNGWDFDNYDKHACDACDVYTADDVNYHIELKEVYDA